MTPTDAPPPAASPSTDPRLLHLASEDNICAAAETLHPGETILFQGRPIVVADRVPTGHKIAVTPICDGEKVVKYGAPIGSATCNIGPGDYVHLHNLKSDYLPAFGVGHRGP